MKRTIVFLGVCIFAVFAIASQFIAEKTDNKLHVYFLNVGQGDSTLIKTPSNKKILIDGGPGKRVLYELSEILSFWDRSFDLVILTHPEKDHLEGLIPVIDRYKIKQFLISGSFKQNQLIDELFKKLTEKNIKLILADDDHDFFIDSKVKVDILFPFKPMIGETDFINSTSIIFKLIHPRKTILFTGDADETLERLLIRKNVNLKADILKIGHHGSKSSTSGEFLEKVKPEKAIISVGQNSYGHPHKDVLSRLKNISAEILRTDWMGRIEFEF